VIRHIFKNLSDGVFYTWGFGDGSPSSYITEPSHVYNTARTFNGLLITLDAISCLFLDTDYVEVFIQAPPVVTIYHIKDICPRDSVQLKISGRTSYQWTTTYNILNRNTDSATVWPVISTSYKLIVKDSTG